EVKRAGKLWTMAFADGEKLGPLQAVGTVGQRNTGTTVRFWPDPRFFDSPKFSIPRLKHVLRAKAVLCPGLHVAFRSGENPGDDEDWYYEEGLSDYLVDELAGQPMVPEKPFVGTLQGPDEEVDWAVAWLVDEEDAAPSSLVQESYVNLIPTPQGGTHVSGFRSGLTEAVREFCEFRDLLPRGLKLAP